VPLPLAAHVSNFDPLYLSRAFFSPLEFVGVIVARGSRYPRVSLFARGSPLGADKSSSLLFSGCSGDHVIICLSRRDALSLLVPLSEAGTKDPNALTDSRVYRRFLFSTGKRRRKRD